MANKIFINYRRSDSNWPAQMIYNKLNERYEYLVFKDLYIASGEDFEKRIQNELHECKVFLSIINKSWLNILQSRSREEIDYVMLEIKVALEENKCIIPILIDDTVMPSQTDLPEEIRELYLKNGCRITLKNFDFEMDKLCDEIDRWIRDSEPPKKVLIIDECSVNGSLVLGMLNQLEKSLNEENGTNKPLSDYFDLIASTGPSSFIVGLLALGNGVDYIIDYYSRYIEGLFGTNTSIFAPLIQSPIAHKAAKILDNTFKDIKLFDPVYKTKFIIYTYNIDHQQVCAFSNFRTPKLEQFGEKILLKDIILASSSIPSYHRPVYLELEHGAQRHVDGSMGVSKNATLSTALFIESEKKTVNWNMNTEQLVIISAGTVGKEIAGKVPKRINILDWARIVPEFTLRNFTDSNDTIVSVISKNSNAEQNSNALISSLDRDAMLFNLYRAELNLEDLPDAIRNLKATDYGKMYEAFRYASESSFVSNSINKLKPVFIK